MAFIFTMLVWEKGYIENIEYFLNGRQVEGSNSDVLIQVVNFFWGGGK
jgi:hypothetical protein